MNAQDMLWELKDRTTRLESRLVQLGDHVGANLRVRMSILIKKDECGVPWVEVDAFDVSISRIVTTLQENGVLTGEIPVVLNGERIAVVYPGRAKRHLRRRPSTEISERVGP